jgi:hypothetical protein
MTIEGLTDEQGMNLNKFKTPRANAIWGSLVEAIPEEEGGALTKQDGGQHESTGDVFRFYVVRRGDTLVKLAFLFDQAVKYIKSINSDILSVTEDLIPGQVLKILDKPGCPHSHLLQDSDSA